MCQIYYVYHHASHSVTAISYPHLQLLCFYLIYSYRRGLAIQERMSFENSVAPHQPVHLSSLISLWYDQELHCIHLVINVLVP